MKLIRVEANSSARVGIPRCWRGIVSVFRGAPDPSCRGRQNGSLTELEALRYQSHSSRPNSKTHSRQSCRKTFVYEPLDPHPSSSFQAWSRAPFLVSEETPVPLISLAGTAGFPGCIASLPGSCFGCRSRRDFNLASPRRGGKHLRLPVFRTK